MSKVDAQRAMREAKYAANQAAAVTRRAPAAPAGAAPAERPAARPTVGSEPTAAEPTAAEPTAAEPELLCGHRNMSNKTCRRPAGHAEKNHRYQ